MVLISSIVPLTRLQHLWLTHQQTWKAPYHLWLRNSWRKHSWRLILIVDRNLYGIQPRKVNKTVKTLVFIHFSSHTLQKEHNETIAKLNFVNALVECIMDLAQSRASPISESFTQKQGEAFTLERVAFISEEQRY